MVCNRGTDRLTEKVTYREVGALSKNTKIQTCLQELLPRHVFSVISQKIYSVEVS